MTFNRCHSNMSKFLPLQQEDAHLQKVRQSGRRSEKCFSLFEQLLHNNDHHILSQWLDIWFDRPLETCTTAAVVVLVTPCNVLFLGLGEVTCAPCHLLLNNVGHLYHHPLKCAPHSCCGDQHTLNTASSPPMMLSISPYSRASMGDM